MPKLNKKKIKFGPKKCFNIHIGSSEKCTDFLKVHEGQINHKEFETYLGDIICSSGSNKKNIENRTNRGIGAVSEIISTLNQVSLGHYHYEIALIFRDSMLISKVVYSAEVWNNITNAEFKKLEEVDEMYFRKIFELPKSAPRIGMYAECGKIPIRYIIKTRRLLYYWHLIHLEDKELLSKFYMAQKLKPGRNDWVMTLKKDMEEIGLKISEEEVKNISLEKFKNMVQCKVKICVKKSFIKKQGSKTEHLKFEISTPSKYLFSKVLNKDEIQTLLKLRTRTIDVKMNQESSYKNNMWCRVCLLFVESQQHIIQCPEVRKKLDYINFDHIKYEMIWGKLGEQEIFAKLYHLALNAWMDIRNYEKSSSTEDPCTSTDVELRQIV